MTLHSYCRNIRGVNDGEDFPLKFVAKIYRSITLNEIKVRSGNFKQIFNEKTQCIAPPPMPFDDDDDDHLHPGGTEGATNRDHHDVDAVVFGYELGQVPGMPAAYHADSRLRDIARGAIAALGEVNVREGMIATGDAFMADPERVATTRAQFPTMLAVEMEGAAIAQTCYLYDCPFVVIRALSDIPGSGDNHLSFEQFLDIAADHSSRMVDQMLIALGETK